MHLKLGLLKFSRLAASCCFEFDCVVEPALQTYKRFETRYDKTRSPLLYILTFIVVATSTYDLLYVYPTTRFGENVSHQSENKEAMKRQDRA